MKFLILAALMTVAAARVRYDGYQVLRARPNNDRKLDFLHNLVETLEGKIAVWAHSRSADHPTDILVQPRFQTDIKELLASADIGYSVMIDDVQSLIDDQQRARSKSAIGGESILDDSYYSYYHEYAEIQQWVKDIASAFSNIAEAVEVTKSGEGRSINAVKISTGGWVTKPAVYWQGGIHAREWVSPATVMYIVKSLLENYGSDSTVTAMLDTFDFYIVPSLNVDGYTYSWETDRLWRKTRSTIAGSTCKGVDPNRNYEYEWGGEGASIVPCSDTYRGPSAASESEVAGSTQFLINRNQEFVCFIDFHSYSQLWLAPWSYTAQAVLPVDKNDHDAAAAKACAALEAVYGTKYTYGPSARTLYAASGCSEDWGYKTLNAKYSYVVELRDTGRYGFLLPENQILPTGKETFAAVLALGQHLLDEY